jgi:hypothetical protein
VVPVTQDYSDLLWEAKVPHRSAATTAFIGEGNKIKNARMQAALCIKGGIFFWWWLSCSVRKEGWDRGTMKELGSCISGDNVENA